MKLDAPKTVKFAGIERKVKVHRGFARLRPGIDVIVLTSGRYYAMERHQTDSAFTGTGDTFQEAVSNLEANALSKFKALGKMLNYDVEK